MFWRVDEENLILLVIPISDYRFHAFHYLISVSIFCDTLTQKTPNQILSL
jgi:hypothetical protein